MYKYIIYSGVSVKNGETVIGTLQININSYTEYIITDYQGNEHEVLLKSIKKEKEVKYNEH